MSFLVYRSNILDIRIFIMSLAILCGISIFIASEAGANNGNMATKPIGVVLKKYTDDLMSLYGVVGTAEGICESQPCIKVFVIRRTPESQKKIPSILDGYPVVIEESGEFHALPENKVNPKVIE